MNATQQASQHVEVRIRTDEYTPSDAVHLCHSPVEGLEDLIAQMKRWGVEVDGNTYTDLSGQFSIGDLGAFFEIIVNTNAANA